MKPLEAFDILVQATGVIQANRETHAKIQEALNVIKTAITPVDNSKEKSV